MSTSSNRAAVIAKTYKILKKHFAPVAPVERPVLEQLLYACCLENTRYEIADESFARIQESFYDWNEVRVTTVRELSELMKGTPDALNVATNLKHTLHSVFESIYDFNLESFKKQNLGVAIKALERFRGTTPFSVSFVVQTCFGGHSIPICRGSLDAMYIVGVINENEYKNQTVPGLERAIPKTKGIEFSSLLHQLAAELVISPFGSLPRNLLLEIDPDCKERLPKRQTRKKIAPKKPAAEKKVAAKADSATDKKAKKTGKTTAPAQKKTAKPAKKLVKKKPAKIPISKKAKKVSKKSSTKKLARRKPR